MLRSIESPLRFIRLDDHKFLRYIWNVSGVLTIVVLMSTFQNKNSLRTIEAEISYKIKNNETRPKFTGSYKKKACRRKSQSSALDFSFENIIHDSK